MFGSYFWMDKQLHEMTTQEWEAICDNCAKCCLFRLQDDVTDEIHFTNVACQYLDHSNCQCTDYANRSIKVPSCITLTLKELEQPDWLPKTCAYRLLAEDKPLPDWHPLLTGSQDSLIESGNAIQGRIICETEADDLQHHLIDWE